MKTSPHWRAVGHAMREARRREGVTVTRVRDGQNGERVFTWSRGVDVVTIAFYDGDDCYRLGIDTDAHELTDGFFGTAQDTLRVLAALGLIPAHLAYGENERFGKCTRCDRLAQWVPRQGPFAGRWCHLNPTRPFHKPEVAYTPTDLAEAGPAAAPTQERDA